jgi:hypothetical protein
MTVAGAGRERAEVTQNRNAGRSPGCQAQDSRPARTKGTNMQAERDHVIRPFLPVWTAALRDETGAAFRQVAAPHVRLEGSIFATPIDGREKVWASLRTGGGITDTLRFAHESATPDRTYLEWELEALGRRFAGVTVLAFDGSGLIDNVALHHRPLGAVLAFSSEMGRRLGDSVGPGVFYQGPQQPIAEPAMSSEFSVRQAGGPS